tara:strand:+ start:317 stop:616 length:300 start_codon:yes stop_codon:yes gene_type:complete
MYITANETMVFNDVLIHTARTWERIRLTREYQEMPYDNIESCDCIVAVAGEIFDSEIIQKFLKSSRNERRGFWGRETKEEFSDEYIENIAHDKICNDYL